MKDDPSMKMTPLDLSVSSQALQMIKLLLPMLPPKFQRTMAVYIKFLEFQNTYQYFSGFSSCSDPIEDLKQYVPSSALETYDMISTMLEMLHTFQDMSDIDPMSMMNAMFQENQPEGESDDRLVK